MFLGQRKAPESHHQNLKAEKVRRTSELSLVVTERRCKTSNCKSDLLPPQSCKINTPRLEVLSSDRVTSDGKSYSRLGEAADGRRAMCLRLLASIVHMNFDYGSNTSTVTRRLLVFGAEAWKSGVSVEIFACSD